MQRPIDFVHESSGSPSREVKIASKGDIRETLMKAFPAPDLSCEAAYFFANLCASAKKHS